MSAGLAATPDRTFSFAMDLPIQSDWPNVELVRNAILETQRIAAPGAKPYNARICDLFYHNPKLVNASAYCHPTITTTQLWIYGAAWAVVALVAGFLLFWEAETRYGRG